MNAMPTRNLELKLLDSSTAFSVVEFQVSQQLSKPFEVSLVVRAGADLDLDATVGQLARFEAWTTRRSEGVEARPQRFSGYVVSAEDAGGDPAGHRYVRVMLAARLWALSQNQNYRVFQQVTEIQIVTKILDEWKIPYRLAIDPSRYKPLRYRIQYAESDLTFVHRNLEAIGVSYSFVEVDGEHVVVLADEPQAAPARQPLTAFDGSPDLETDYASNVSMSRRARPGRFVTQDLDYRRSNQELRQTAQAESSSIEGRLEQYQYAPGSSHRIVEAAGSDTPAADDKGAARTDERYGQFVTQLRLEARQADRWQIAFGSNVLDLAPGVVVPIKNHDRLEPAGPVLVTRTFLQGSDTDEWSIDCNGVLASAPYRPLPDTQKPKAGGLESATVVGPRGSEISTDEYGRVRVQFRWDREGKLDADSSCWVPVSQGSAGAGFGSVALPRIGQEVLVDFLGGDVDKPIIVGRLYTQLQPLPFKMPDNQTKTVICRTQTVGGQGYNQIVAEDAAGREQLGFHAQRDLDTVVRNDMQESVGNNRTSSVGSTWSFDALPPTEGAAHGGRSGLDWSHDMLAITVGSSKITASDGEIRLSVGDSSVVINGQEIRLLATKVAIDGETLVDVHGGTIQLNC